VNPRPPFHLPTNRREVVQLLSTLLGASATLPLAACSSGNKGKAGTNSGSTSGTSEDIEDEVVPPPRFDAAALSDAMGLVLAAIPVDIDVDALLVGVQEEVDAVHEAGLINTAAWMTATVDEVVIDTMGAFGAAFPANGPLEDADRKAISEELVGSLTSGCATLHAGLPAVTEELQAAFGTDTVAADTGTAAALGEFETGMREWLHAQETGEGNLSGQLGANSMLYKMQEARVQASTAQSIASTSQELTDALDILGVASGTSASSRHARTRTWRRSATAPPPPDSITDFCSTFESVAFVVDLAIDIRQAFKASAAAATKASENYWKWLAEIPEESAHLRDRYWSWVAAELSEEVVETATGKLESAARGAIVTELSEEECDFMSAILLTVFFIIDMVLLILAFAKLLTPLFEALALAGGGLYALLMVVLLVALLYFMLKVFCSAIKLKPALDTFAGVCAP